MCVSMVFQHLWRARSLDASCLTGSRGVLTRQGFKSVYKPRRAGRQFAELLDAVAAVDPEMRIRFTSPHPKDFSDDVIEVKIPNPLFQTPISSRATALKIRVAAADVAADRSTCVCFAIEDHLNRVQLQAFPSVTCVYLRSVQLG